MKPGVLLFRVTGAVLGLQLLLGGLLTFGFISAEAHIVAGFLLFILAFATMAVWLTTKPPFRPMQVLTSVIVFLILLQIILGFATLGTGSPAVAFIHFANALAIFGATMAGAFTALRWDRMAPGSPASGNDERPTS
jgi:heme A synthase